MSIYQFRMSGNIAVSKLIKQISEAIPLHGEPTEKFLRSYYDTFDWRLYRHGVALEARSSTQGIKLCRRFLDKQALASCICIRLTKMPVFAWDFPPGPLREALLPVLDVRALLPLVSETCHVQHWKVINRDQKTVCRLHVETCHAENTGHSTPRHKRVQIEPVRGYTKAANQLLALLRNISGLEAIEHELYLSSLSAAGITPGDYSSRLVIPLEPQMRADEAEKTILLTLLDILVRNEDGTLRNLDSEFLHDFRVAVRRTRSALTQIKGVLPAKILERFGGAFAWLGTVTSAARDMDVYLSKYHEYQAALPQDRARHLQPLQDYLLAQQKKEYQSLRRALQSSRYRRLITDWRHYLISPVPAYSRLPNAMRTVHAVASARIWKVYRCVMKEGEAIGPESPAMALHELRKTCKKLRYLMEFFQGLYPQKKIIKPIKTLKLLQENLGDYQDLHVQIESLKRFRREMETASTLSELTRQAMAMLMNILDQRQHDVRGEFARSFQQFSQTDNRYQFKLLFRPARPAKVEAL